MVPLLLIVVVALTLFVTVKSIVGDVTSTVAEPPVGSDPTSVCLTWVPEEIMAIGIIGAADAAEPITRKVYVAV